MQCRVFSLAVRRPHNLVRVLNPAFPLRQFIRCAKCNKGLTAGIAKKKFPYYWCYKPGGRSVFISAEKLENEFVALLKMHQPTMELLERLPEIAKQLWKVRQEVWNGTPAH